MIVLPRRTFQRAVASVEHTQLASTRDYGVNQSYLCVDWCTRAASAKQTSSANSSRCTSYKTLPVIADGMMVKSTLDTFLSDTLSV